METKKMAFSPTKFVKIKRTNRKKRPSASECWDRLLLRSSSPTSWAGLHAPSGEAFPRLWVHLDPLLSRWPMHMVHNSESASSRVMLGLSASLQPSGPLCRGQLPPGACMCPLRCSVHIHALRNLFLFPCTCSGQCG